MTESYPEFEVHQLNPRGIVNAEAIGILFRRLLTSLLNMNPQPSREMSLVRTKLEEASFFAKKAMANQLENQKAATVGA